jgi:hypothetical protein
VPTIGDCPFDTVLVDVLSMDDHPTKRGNKKVLIFMDSLTRWVEAAPLTGEPTSLEVLNLFCELVVTRYGMPRCVRNDSGSNLSSNLVKAIYDHFEIELRLGTPEHHQSQGAIERFNDTLVGMTRTAVMDGSDWDDHLPFLLYTYRATPHRVTTHSPAYLLYGRELRRPTPTSLDRPVDPGNMTPEQRRNAERIVGGMRSAWAASHSATKQAQLTDRDKTDMKHDHALVFVPNERVLIRREGLLPKLAPRYDGPYRVAEALPGDNYKLRDLTSRRRRETVHVSRLRPYLTITDEERLAPDEYLIERLLDYRERPLPDGTTAREYLVKWQGYPKAEASWTSRDLLVVRDAVRELVAEFDASRVPALPTHPPAAAPPEAPDPAPLPAPVPAMAPGTDLPMAEPDPEFPLAARQVRGRWLYQFPTGGEGLHGPRTRWYPESSFSPAQIAAWSGLRAVAAVVDESSYEAFFLPVAAARSRPRPRTARPRSFEAPVRPSVYAQLPANASRKRGGALRQRPRMRQCGEPYGREPPPSSYKVPLRPRAPGE